MLLLLIVKTQRVRGRSRCSPSSSRETLLRFSLPIAALSSSSRLFLLSRASSHFPEIRSHFNLVLSLSFSLHFHHFSSYAPSSPILLQLVSRNHARDSCQNCRLLVSAEAGVIHVREEGEQKRSQGMFCLYFQFWGDSGLHTRLSSPFSPVEVSSRLLLRREDLCHTPFTAVFSPNRKRKQASDFRENRSLSQVMVSLPFVVSWPDS